MVPAHQPVSFALALQCQLTSGALLNHPSDNMAYRPYYCFTRIAYAVWSALETQYPGDTRREALENADANNRWSARLEDMFVHVCAII